MIRSNDIIENLKTIGLDEIQAVKLAIRANLEGDIALDLVQKYIGKFSSIEDIVDFFPEYWEPRYEESWYIRDIHILEDWICRGLLRVALSRGCLFVFKGA